MVGAPPPPPKERVSRLKRFNHKNSKNPPPPLPLLRCPHCPNGEPPHNWTESSGLISDDPRAGAGHTQPFSPLSVSPRVHLQPRVQLSGFWSVHPGQNVSTVDMDDFHRQVTHLTGLIQRLRERGAIGFHWTWTGYSDSNKGSCPPLHQDPWQEPDPLPPPAATIIAHP